MRIAIVGCGYVGLVSGACFADFGHSVTCVDSDTARIEALRRGELPIFEPGLATLIAANVEAGRLVFTDKLGPAVAEAEIVFIAVGTPLLRGDGHADVSFVHAAAADIAKAVSGFTVVVTKSTVPVGTGDEVERIIRSANPDADVMVVANPEFLREGAAINDFKHPDRIVIGIENERARAPMVEVYRTLDGIAPLLFTTRRSAELIKYAANAFLAVKLTFINEMADLCEKTGTDVQDIARGIGLDRRIAPEYLNAGPGYGGSCLPKDTLALTRTGQQHESPLRLVETAMAVNDARKQAMGLKIIAACGGSVRGMKVAILGLTFAPNTDDLRESPAIAVIEALQEAAAKVAAFDPQGMAGAKTLLRNLQLGTSAYDVAADADCLVIVTEWNEFRSLDFDRLRGLMRTPLLVDLRNIYRRADVEAHGFTYESVGRPASAGNSAQVDAAH